MMLASSYLGGSVLGAAGISAAQQRCEPGSASSDASAHFPTLVASGSVTVNPSTGTATAAGNAPTINASGAVTVNPSTGTGNAAAKNGMLVASGTASLDAAHSAATGTAHDVTLASVLGHGAAAAVGTSHCVAIFAQGSLFFVPVSAAGVANGLSPLLFGGHQSGGLLINVRTGRGSTRSHPRATRSRSTLTVS